ncbi:MAG: cysteine desulfurase NifS [Candidatus Nealsonbacteria bacterium RBG_13_36_15]|uniref:Cysteine desulfurase NifS n=1 Tax=Candidatus Nealsonbacteria bacterium RBG_13_36_15 TaxID=1801660 RepID=A0A1G2DYN3_9BACT|nr:MAG: cysteine desulfurase NifS [Candidatus Nealsonbacteria bacterium RBG_13_36_15]
MRKVYIDHAATTYMDKKVFRAMEPYFEKVYGNPSSIHKEGRKAKYALYQARKKVAQILGCQLAEIIFTGSGTESCNLAIFGMAEDFSEKKGHIITSKIEHHAILRPCEKLEKKGFSVTYLPVDREGIVDVLDIQEAVKPETFLISIIYANNEIGVIQSIAEIGKLIKRLNTARPPKSKIYFHTDACQAAGFLDLNVNKLGVDLLSLNGSKIYGPKGVGMLFVRQGIPIKPMILGGGQEEGLRAGTENLAGIIGFAKALEIVQRERKKESARLIKLRDYLISGIEKKIPKIVLNGHREKRLPNNVNVSILDIEGEAALLWLDKYGIYALTGSACDSQSLEPSHVILALGRPYEYAHGSLRFSLGRKTTKKDIDYLLKVLPRVVKTLREISPITVKL